MSHSRNEIIAIQKGYEITPLGEVKGVSGRLLSLSDKEGYKRFKIRLDGGYKNISVHRLQAYKKFGDKLYGHGIVVRHLNGNPSDNSWDNIEIGTHSDNMYDIDPEVRLAKAKHASSFMQVHDHEKVYEFYKKCRSYKKTMEEFDISSKGTLNFIIKKYE